MNDERLGDFEADRLCSSGGLDRHRTIERSHIEDRHGSPGLQPEGIEILKQIRRLVRALQNLRLDAFRMLGETVSTHLIHVAVRLRNGIAVGIDPWASEIGIESFGKHIGGRMLESTGMLVDIGLRHFQHIVAEGLPETMTPNH